MYMTDAARILEEALMQTCHVVPPLLAMLL